MARLVSFSELAFEPDPGITGFEMARVADDTRGLVKFWRVPAGWGIGRLGIEGNLHFHRRAWEYAAVLEGDFPHVEYDKARDALRRIRFGAGDLMIRAPGSLHGLHADMTVQRRCTMLYWNTGPGTSLLDANYAEETVDVDGDVARWREQLNDDCVITTVDREGPPAGWEASRANDAFRVGIRRMAAGDAVDVAALAGDDHSFALLWLGGCTAAWGSLQQGSVLLGEAVRDGVTRPDGVASRIVATTPCCWLVVQRRRAAEAIPG